MAEALYKGRGSHGIDALLPPEMTLACDAAGAAKAGRDTLALFVLDLLAPSSRSARSS